MHELSLATARQQRLEADNALLNDELAQLHYALTLAPALRAGTLLSCRVVAHGQPVSLFDARVRFDVLVAPRDRSAALPPLSAHWTLVARVGVALPPLCLAATASRYEARVFTAPLPSLPRTTATDERCEAWRMNVAVPFAPACVLAVDVDLVYSARAEEALDGCDVAGAAFPLCDTLRLDLFDFARVAPVGARHSSDGTLLKAMFELLDVDAAVQSALQGERRDWFGF